MGFIPSYRDEQKIRDIRYQIDEAWKKKFSTDQGPTVSELFHLIQGIKGDDHTPNISSFRNLMIGKPDAALYNPGVSILIVIADALDTTVDALLGNAIDRSSLEVSAIEAKYGLSASSLSFLEELKSKTKDNSTAAKVLWIINYILEKSCVSEDKNVIVDDFLITVSRLVSNGFSSYENSLLEAILDLSCKDTYSDRDAYRNILNETEIVNRKTNKYKSLTSYELINDFFEANEKRKIQLRKAYVLTSSQNKYNTDIIESYLSNGIIPVFDPINNDEVWFKLPSPINALKENLLRIIDNWHTEYMDKVYSFRRKQVYPITKNYNYNNDSVKSVEDLEAAEKLAGDDKNTYRNIYTHNLPEDQMKLYLAFEFIEHTPLKYMSFDHAGKLIFPEKAALHEDQFVEIIKNASEAGTGLFLGADGEVHFDAQKATDPDFRLKYQFERYFLPIYYEFCLQTKNLSQSFRRMLYVDYDRYTDDQYKNVMTSARKARLAYSLSLEYIDIYVHKYEEDEARYRRINKLDTIEASAEEKLLEKLFVNPKDGGRKYPEENESGPDDLQ